MRLEIKCNCIYMWKGLVMWVYKQKQIIYVETSKAFSFLLELSYLVELKRE